VNDLLLLLGFVTLSTPLVVVLHEAGHLIPALLLTDGPVTFRVGPRGEALVTARLGRVTFQLMRRVFRGGGEVISSGVRTRRDATLLVGGGPAATALTGLGVGLLAGIGLADAWPRGLTLACTGFALNSIVGLWASGRSATGTHADGTPYLSDGERLARLAGKAPPPPPPQRASLAAPERPERAR
jgi:hypothetical protein